jgi:hypothetical protein
MATTALTLNGGESRNVRPKTWARWLWVHLRLGYHLTIAMPAELAASIAVRLVNAVNDDGVPATMEESP